MNRVSGTQCLSLLWETFFLKKRGYFRARARSGYVFCADVRAPSCLSHTHTAHTEVTEYKRRVTFIYTLINRYMLTN